MWPSQRHTLDVPFLFLQQGSTARLAHISSGVHERYLALHICRILYAYPLAGCRMLYAYPLAGCRMVYAYQHRQRLCIANLVGGSRVHWIYVALDVCGATCMWRYMYVAYGYALGG